MDYDYNPLSDAEQNESSGDSPEETVLITVEDYYDLLMEQQEQM